MDGTALVGMHFVLHHDDEHSQTGKIVEMVQRGGKVAAAYLVQLDGKEGVPQPPLELATIFEMTETCEHGVKNFMFFRTREDLDAWLKFIDGEMEGEGKRVVELVPKGRGK